MLLNNAVLVEGFSVDSRPVFNCPVGQGTKLHAPIPLYRSEVTAIPEESSPHLFLPLINRVNRDLVFRYYNLEFCISLLGLRFELRV